MTGTPLAQGPSTGVLLAAACVVAGDQVLRPGWVAIDNGRVTATGRGAPPRPPDRDFGDATLVPGFVDVHVHGGGGGSFAAADVEQVDKAVALHRRHGTTTMLASLVTAGPDELRRQVGMLADLVEQGLLAGIHLEGPWLSHRRCGAHQADQLRDPERRDVREVLEAGRGTVRMVTIAPERAGGLDAIRQVVDAGAVAAVGHTDATYEIACEAIAAGARVATHLFNAMRPIHHREPGPIVALLEDSRVNTELVLDRLHLHPAIYRQVVSAVDPQRVVLVTDAMAAAGMPDGSYRLGALEVEVSGGAARLAGTNTLAGSTATMDQLFRNAVALGASDPDDALLTAVRQSSANPAAVFGWTGHDLTPGATADLVVLDPTLVVHAVMRAGAWV